MTGLVACASAKQAFAMYSFTSLCTYIDFLVGGDKLPLLDPVYLVYYIIHYEAHLYGFIIDCCFLMLA